MFDTTVVVTVPTFASPLPAAPRRINLHLAPREARALRAVIDGLSIANAKVAGRRVSTPATALRWMLDQVADKSEQ